MLLDKQLLIDQLDRRRMSWSQWTWDSIYSWIFYRSIRSDGPNSKLCLGCPDAINSIQAQLFHDILETTASPALAVQAHTSNLLRMAYYAWISFSDVAGWASTTYAVRRLAPKPGWGFWAVIGIICAHMTLCIVIAIMFFCYTRYSLLRNA